MIRTPDQRLRVFVSSSLTEFREERSAVRRAIERLRLIPVVFEGGARPYPAQEIYRSYLEQSDLFIAIYGRTYGYVAPGMEVSGLEDEYDLAEGRPRLIYIRLGSEQHREPALAKLVARIKATDRVSYQKFSTLEELEELVLNDLALLLSERFARKDHEVLVPLQLKQKVVLGVHVKRHGRVRRRDEHESFDRMHARALRIDVWPQVAENALEHGAILGTRLDAFEPEPGAALADAPHRLGRRKTVRRAPAVRQAGWNIAIVQLDVLGRQTLC